MKLHLVDTVEPVKQAALKMLRTRSCTRLRLQELLQEQGHCESDINAALTRLEAVGLINDLEYARDYLYFHAKNTSQNVLCLKLRSAGVEKEVIAQAISELENNREWNIALECGEKKLRSLREGDNRVRKQKLYAYLARRGFESALCLKACEHLLNSD